MSLRTASTLVAFALTASSTLAFQAAGKAGMAGRVTEQSGRKIRRRGKGRAGRTNRTGD